MLALSGFGRGTGVLCCAFICLPWVSSGVATDLRMDGHLFVASCPYVRPDMKHNI